MKRYSVSLDASAPDSIMEEDPKGEYVEFSEVEVLLAELNLLRSQARRTEVAPRTMPAPPPSMNYLEREAWKLGWYNAIYEKDPRGAWPPFPTGNEPQHYEQSKEKP